MEVVAKIMAFMHACDRIKYFNQVWLTTNDMNWFLKGITIDRPRTVVLMNGVRNMENWKKIHYDREFELIKENFSTFYLIFYLIMQLHLKLH